LQRSIHIERVLPYHPDLVWKAVTDPRALGAWFMENDFEPRLGHEFRFRMKPQRGWDGLTHCQVLELEPQHRVAFSYRGEATGEKTLACAGIRNDTAASAAKGIFTRLDTVLSFTVTPERLCDGTEHTRLVLEHTGFRGFQLVIVSFVMDFGWRRVLTRLPSVLEALALSRPLPPRPGAVSDSHRLPTSA
jgi:uncharacterized protein YndB with AHSA1/START domain